jgi:hypothetical protein
MSSPSHPPPPLPTPTLPPLPLALSPQSDPSPRLERHEIHTYVNAILNQYDAEDFDLGIKQFMIEQEIERQMADGLDKKGDNKDFEEKLAEQLFAEETIEKVQVGAGAGQSLPAAGC